MAFLFSNVSLPHIPETKLRCNYSSLIARVLIPGSLFSMNNHTFVPDMQAIFAIGLGSFIGGISRYLLTQFVHTNTAGVFPFATLSVNLIGCFLIGLILGFGDKVTLSNEFKLFLATGILGGFTTFSAFSLETVNLVRDGQVFHAASYVGASVGLGILATLAGILITRSLSS